VRKKHRHEHDADAERGDEGGARAISCEPMRMASSSGLPEVMWRWMFLDGPTVASSTRMPTAERHAAERHQIDGLAPARSGSAMEQRMDSGMESAMMNVLRHEPRNSRIIRAVNEAADDAFPQHAADGGADEQRLVGEFRDVQVGGHG